MPTPERLIPHLPPEVVPTKSPPNGEVSADWVESCLITAKIILVPAVEGRSSVSSASNLIVALLSKPFAL